MNMNRQEFAPEMTEQTDAELVAASLAGDTRAFTQIVSRYQSLLCSLAYSSLGSLAHSEDVAQEAFVEAWNKLPALKEPEKLKAWLCGILRFKLSHHYRREARQPSSGASELDRARELASESASVEESAMSEEEQALLWQSLEKVPARYREVMILYYREHRSVANVAAELEISEATVRQRLSRGRKMLQERVMDFIEEALTRSTPGHVFTAGVVAALPLAAVTPAKAAGMSALGTKTASALQWTSFAAFLASVSGFISSALALRATLDRTRTRRERRRVIRAVIAFVATALLFCGGLFALRQLAIGAGDQAALLAWVAQGLVLCFVVGYAWLTHRSLRDMRTLRTAERLRRPERFAAEADRPGSSQGEYRSRLALFGIPLVHLKFALPEENEPPAIGWIAAGERAYGILFAWGGYAVGFISVGIFSVGVLSVGAVGCGLIGVGTVGVGALAIGAAAIGIHAFGSLSALGWTGAAGGGFAVAKYGAAGPIAIAGEANNEAAAELLKLSLVDQSFGIIMLVIAGLVLIPVTLYAQAVRRRLRQ